MYDIETEGFLAVETHTGDKFILDAYADVFEFARDLNKYCMKLLSTRKVDWEENRKLTVQALFLRSVEIFQSVIIMLEIGLMPAAKILTRGLLEIVFTLVALQKKPELFEAYLYQHHKSQLYNLKSMLGAKSKALKNAIKEHDLEKKYLALKEDLKGKKFDTLGPKDWSKAAELEDFYIVYYNIYSDSTHSNPSALDDHVDNKPEEINLAFGPSDTDLYDVLKCCVLCLLNAASSGALAHGENITKELDEFAKKIGQFDQKYI